MKPYPLFIIVLVFSTIRLNAQLGINTTTPRASLEIGTTGNGGVLLPSYALTGNNDTATVVNPQGGALVAGTVVYNTATVTGTTAIDPGVVYWNGYVWRNNAGSKLIGEKYRSTDGATLTANTDITLNTAGYNRGVTLTNSDNITIITPGVYSVVYTVSAVRSAGTNSLTFYLAKNGTEVNGSRTYMELSADPVWATVTKQIFVTAVANDTFSIKPTATNANVSIKQGTAISVELLD